MYEYDVTKIICRGEESVSIKIKPVYSRNTRHHIITEQANI